MGLRRPYNNGDRLNHFSMGKMSKIRQFITEMRQLFELNSSSSANQLRMAQKCHFFFHNVDIQGDIEMAPVFFN